MKNNSPLCKENAAFSRIRVAVCGHLPTACNCLLKCGVVQIDQFSDATEIANEASYHLILIYAPQAEGLLNTKYLRSMGPGGKTTTIPLRLLNEPACNSALIELRSTLRRIERNLSKEDA